MYDSLEARLSKDRSAPLDSAPSVPATSESEKAAKPAKEAQESPVPSVPTEEELRAMVAEELKKLVPAESKPSPTPALPPWLKWTSKWSDSDGKDDSEAPWMYWAKKYADEKGVPGVTVVDDKTAESVYPSQVKNTKKD
ncbi:uncharacterized protein LOC106661243 [Cimex lectularius]|uniref:Uncharacterized protein n=1 Tax=Cimex lectularius TaxID=79782 RepID=A0A8I6R7P3_CIMLE|nr:uncharacterized protein LOC106661243 [Cimex lectularius]